MTDLPEAQGGELVFNSRSPKEMQVTPTLYKRDGTAIVCDPVTIQSAEIRYVDFKSLLPVGHWNEQDWGGLSLSYYGVAREMWAQFRLLGINGGSNADEFFTVKGEQRSDVQEAAWWMPKKSAAIIALGNITDQPTGATISFGDGDSQTVNLTPHGTEIIRHNRAASDGTESVKIQITGMPGSIIPTGLIASYDGSFNSVIRFYDTKKAKQPHLFGNGFRLAGITPHMVLKNTSASPIIAQPKFITLGGVDSADPVSLPDVNLAPGATTEVDLTSLLQAVSKRHDLDVVSVQVNNSGDPGTLIGSLYGINGTTGVSYDTPLRDSGPARSMTGSYPWKVSEDYTTIVYITNITDEQAEFTGEINYSGGHYLLDARKLAPGETAPFDLREIQAKQEENKEHQKMSKDASLGQFKWAVRGDTKGKIVLIGRAEMMSLSQNISTSYSCNDPCPPEYDGWIDPLPPIIFVNNTGQSAAWEQVTYAQGYMVGPYAVGASWSLDNQVGTLDPSAGSSTTLTGTTPGIATLDGFISTQSRYSWDGLNCYYDYSYDEGGQTDTEVADVGKIQYQSGSSYVDITGTLYVLKGTSVTFKAVPDPATATFESGKPVWSGSSGATGTGETTSVTFNTTSSSTSDFKTVIATAGNSQTVNVIVYELTGKLTPQDNFTGRSTTDFGVAEVINLSFTATPAITATQAGGLLWKQTTGNGNLTGMSDGTGTYTAASSPESVTLKLEIQDGPSKGLGPSSTINVIAPSGAYQVQNPGTNVAHNNGTCSAGFKAITYLLPKNVSFSNIEAREGTTLSTATGWLAPSNNTTHPTGSWLPVANCALSTGCLIQAVDTVYNEYPQNYGGTTWGVGDFQWNIPREWRVGTGSATQYTTLLHHFVSDSTGKGTISKDGAGPFSKNASDPTSTY